MKQGTSTGVLDEFLTPICVGDEIVDKAGTHYTIDRFGRAKPTSGGNEVPIKNLEGVTVCKSWAGHAESITKAAEAKVKAVVDDFYGNKPEVSEEEKAPKNLDPVQPILKIPPLSQEELEAIKNHDLGRHIEIRPAIERFGDQELADELRRRGYEVTATKTTIVEL